MVRQIKRWRIARAVWRSASEPPAGCPVNVGRRKFVEVLINNEPIELQLDCGSDYTIISTDSLPLLGNPETIPTELRVATASGKPLPLELEFECDVTFRGTTKRSVCYVTPVRGFKVLGSDLMDAFGLCTTFRSTTSASNSQLRRTRRRVVPR